MPENILLLRAAKSKSYHAVSMCVPSSKDVEASVRNIVLLVNSLWRPLKKCAHHVTESSSWFGGAAAAGGTAAGATAGGLFGGLFGGWPSWIKLGND